ncbi:PIG-L family deacetylase [Mucilaginibacter sp. AW1-7]|uniref:PIG-L family deacetylase n=1 Tax=Mucilaginibacter sp. AW1-7 TaxID=3349874 RepID=UPI003F738B5B
MKKLIVLLLTVVFYLGGLKQGRAQVTAARPRILVVMAHPDDESTFSVTLYKIAKEQHGIVDLFVITNGEAGYKYATLAETYYGIELTDEKTGRANLPRIRKRELVNAGHILGVNEYYFIDQKDAHYTSNEKEPLDTSWNVNTVNNRLRQVLTSNHYDFIFTLLPETGTHGAHKAAALIALNAITTLPADNRPVILGAATCNKADTVTRFKGDSSYAQTMPLTDTANFKVDRTASFSYKNRVNYKVIANWEIAEHKSQGVTQMTMNDGDVEHFWYFAVNGNGGLQKTRALFRALSYTPYLPKSYQDAKPLFSKSK